MIVKDESLDSDSRCSWAFCCSSRWIWLDVQNDAQFFLHLLLFLLQQKITVNDIADRADINRGTVYLHFLDKYDILEKCIDKYVDELLSQCSDNEDIHLQEDAMGRVFSYLEEHIELYKLLHENDKYGIFRRKFTNALLGQVSIAMAVMPEEIASSHEIASQFLVNGLLGVIEWWISSDMPCSSEEVTDRLLTFLKPFQTVDKLYF